MGTTLLVATALLVCVFFAARRLRADRPQQRAKSVAIIVLGDIGRSPRMLYHANSFVAREYKTHIVAYRGSNPPVALLESEHAHFEYLATPLGWTTRLPRALYLLCAPFKVIAAAGALFWALVWTVEVAPAFMFVQNPPAIPTLFVVQIAAYLRGSRVIIDWHNTGHSVLALRLGPRSPVVRLAKWLEEYSGRTAYAHLCVTAAMRESLLRDARITGKSVLFIRLPSFSSLPLLSFFPPVLTNGKLVSTPFTTSSTSIHSTTADLRLDRPALLVSATSWTPDEDFSLLLRALSLYDTAAASMSAGPVSRRLPRVIMVITGKGSERAEFERRVAELETGWNWVRVRTEWLAIEDYPLLLGAADLGISLHTSTSGADLPMKVVDMFGSGLPVCALDFACLGELVQDRVNGRTFATSDDLANQLIELLRSFPTFPSPLDLLRAGIKDAYYAQGERWMMWEDNWAQVVEPLLN